MANFFSQEYLRHLHDVNVMKADVYPKVSETIPQIVSFIQGLIDTRVPA